MAPWNVIAALSASASVLLIISTYLWSKMQRPDEIEIQVLRRWDGARGAAGNVTMSVISAVVEEADDRLERWKKYVVLHPQGSIKIDVRFKGDELKNPPWGRGDFLAFCKEHELEPEYEIRRPGGRDGVTVIFEFDTLEQNQINAFLRELPGFVAEQTEDDR